MSDPLAGVEAPRVRVGILVEAAGAAASARSGLAVHGRLPGETATLVRHVATATFVPAPGSEGLRLQETGDELLLARVELAIPDAGPDTGPDASSGQDPGQDGEESAGQEPANSLH